MKTRKSFTSIYNPRCNGAVERVNGTLTKKLAMMYYDDIKEWDSVLPYATFAYNICISPKTGLSHMKFFTAKNMNFKLMRNITIK